MWCSACCSAYCCVCCSVTLTHDLLCCPSSIRRGAVHVAVGVAGSPWPTTHLHSSAVFHVVRRVLQCMLQCMLQCALQYMLQYVLQCHLNKRLILMVQQHLIGHTRHTVTCSIHARHLEYVYTHKHRRDPSVCIAVRVAVWKTITRSIDTKLFEYIWTHE